MIDFNTLWLLYYEWKQIKINIESGIFTEFTELSFKNFTSEEEENRNKENSFRSKGE